MVDVGVDHVERSAMHRLNHEHLDANQVFTHVMESNTCNHRVCTLFAPKVL